MAEIQIAMPMMMFTVAGSENARVPIRIAVTGSNTPRTEVFVGPIILVETASARRETIVGKIASPKRLTMSIEVSMPVRKVSRSLNP